MPEPSRSFELTLGGIHFAIESRPGLRVVERDPNYRSFLGAREPDAYDLEVPVELELERAPDCDGLEVLFDSGSSWTAHQDGVEVLLRLRSPVGPLWIARLPAHEGPVTVYCGSRLVERSAAAIEVTNPLHYPLDQLLVMFLLAERRGILVHGAGVLKHGHGMVLAGPSGAGKSTFMRLCQHRPEVLGLSDDRVIVRRIDESLVAYGTPWAGEGQIAVNRCAKLGALLFLHKATRNELRPLSPREALEQLLPTTSILWFDRERLGPELALCEEVVEGVPAYELHFRPEPQAVDLLDELL